MRNYMLRRTLLAFVLISLSSCSFFENYSSKKEKSLEFIDALLAEDFAKCVDLMPWELHPQISKDTMQSQFRSVKRKIDAMFGKNLRPTFLKSITDKDYTHKEPVISELGLVQLANDTCYGNFEIRFDDKTGKVDNIELVSIHSIPDKFNLYFFAVLGLLVLFLNLYIIKQVIKSELKGKWKWILIVIFLNYPALVYSLIKGPFISWSHFALLGFDYTFRNIDESRAIMAFPIGALIVLWKLNIERNQRGVITD
jgi:hypothetical protein